MTYSLELREAIAREIRRFRPNVVVGGSGELVTAWGFDHADHRAAGIATIDAVRDADNRWVFPQLLRDGLGPWGAKWLFVVASSRPTHHVAVTEDGRNRAVASLEALICCIASVRRCMVSTPCSQAVRAPRVKPRAPDNRSGVHSWPPGRGGGS